MKALIFSLVLFTLVIGLVIANAIYINRASEDIKSLALSVANGESEASDKLIERWDRQKTIMALTVGLREVDAVSEQIIKLCVASSLGNSDAVATSYALLCDAIDDITRYERLSAVG